MSPERVEGKEHGFDSDIWSIGVCTYEMATGEFPFKSKNYFEVLEELSTFKQLNFPSYMSESLKDFITACLQPERTKRPALKILMQHNFFELNLKEDVMITTPVSDWLKSVKPATSQ